MPRPGERLNVQRAIKTILANEYKMFFGGGKSCSSLLLSFCSVIELVSKFTTKLLHDEEVF